MSKAERYIRKLDALDEKDGQWPDCSYESGDDVCWAPAHYIVRENGATYYSCKEHKDEPAS